jgi:transposase
MMRPDNCIQTVYLCKIAVDFRKGINGLSVLVESTLLLSPFSEHLFVFVNKSRDKIKILYWEKSGFCLWQKRLEKETFKWPRYRQEAVISLTGQQLNWLLDGYDLRKMTPHTRLNYSTVL